MHRFTRTALALLVAMAMPLFAEEGLTRTVLDNGAVLLIKEDHNMPVVTLQAWFPVGSITEGENMGQGLSHYVEHMIFKGTEKQAPGDFARAVKAAGGELNAYTYFDRTVFHCIVRSEKFSEMLDSFSDVIMNSKMDGAEATKEKFVIVNELKMYEDDPNRIIQYAYNETAWRVHPCRHPIGGYTEQFKKLKPEDVGIYFRRWYAPNNMVFVAVGDIDGATATALVKKSFGSWPRRAVAPVTLPEEPLQQGPRRETRTYPVKGATSGARLKIGWPGVDGHDPDAPALDMASMVLSHGEGSRLNRVLRNEKRLVQSIGAGNDTPGRYRGHFSIAATLAPENLEATELEMLAQVERLKTELVSVDELSRIVRAIEASIVLGLQDVMSQADDLALGEMEYGNPRISRIYNERLKAVTPEQIRDAVRKYLVADRLTVAAVVPAESGGADTVVPETAPSKFEAHVEEFTTSNGIRVVLRNNPSTAAFGFTMAFMAGSRLEPEAHAGVANLAAEMLMRGTTNRTPVRLADEIAKTGGSLRVQGGRNTMLVNAEMLSTDFEKSLELAADLLMNPKFDPNELANVKRFANFQLERQQRDAAGATSLRFHKLMYGDHPYSRTPLGSAESIAADTVEDLKAFHAQFIHPKNCVLAIVGDLKADRVKAALEKYFAGFKAREEALPAVTEVGDLAKGVTDDQTDPTKSMGVAFIGFQTVKISGKDRWTLQVIENILGGMGGRLWDQVREKRNLAYSVWAANVPMLDRGYIQFGVMAQGENVDPALEVMWAEIARIAEGPIGEVELRSAKNKVIGENLIALQKNAAQAQALALDTMYGLGPQALFDVPRTVEAIDENEVRRVAKQYLVREKAVLVVTRPGAK